jgi:hypothetical protein
MTSGETDSVRDLHSTELLIRIQIRGVIDAGTARALLTEIGISDEDVRDLVRDGALADDGGLLYVTEGGDQRLTDDLAGRVAAGELPEVLAFADEFDELDLDMKSALTAWQHAVQAQDEEAQMTAVQRWLDVDSRLHAAASRAESTARLFSRCLARLAAARERVLDGDVDQLSGPGDSSYHTVWFLLHEMLLRSLRRQRTRG